MILYQLLSNILKSPSNFEFNETKVFIKYLPVLGVFLGLIMWMFDSLVDVFIIKSQDKLITAIFTDDSTEMWMRTLVMLVFVVSAFVVQHFMRKQLQIEFELCQRQNERDMYLKELEKSYLELEFAQANAEKANGIKKQFLANMSHELRTPLNAIIGYAELMREEMEGDIALGVYRDDCRKINLAGKHLLTLINELLDLSKIESGKMEVKIEPFELDDLLTSVHTLMEANLRSDNNVLKVDCSADTATVFSDKTKLKQIILNLLSNASKFTANDEILMTVNNFKLDDNEWLLITISDNGAGIPNHKIESIFAEYEQQGKSSEKNRKGNGLGLALSRRLAHLLGGDLVVTSEEHKGTKCFLTFPVDRRSKFAA